MVKQKLLWKCLEYTDPQTTSECLVMVKYVL